MEKNTILFTNTDKNSELTIKEILQSVYGALEEKGYEPLDQIVGYILSGDPSYITSHNNARNLIKKVDRDDLVTELLKKYLGL